MKKNSKSGIVTIPIVLVLMALIIIAGLAISAVSINETYTSKISAESSQALAYAQAGAQDALQKLTRNSSYNCPTDACYSIDFVDNGCSTSNGCAKVKITNSPKIIVSEGDYKNSIRKVQVTVTFDSDGVITGEAWQEL